MVDGPQAKSIVSIKANAPEGARRYYLFSDGKVYYYKYFFNHPMQWIENHGWFPCDECLLEDTKPL